MKNKKYSFSKVKKKPDKESEPKKKNPYNKKNRSKKTKDYLEDLDDDYIEEDF